MDNKIVQQNDVFIEKYGSGRFEGFRFYINQNSVCQATDTQNLADNENLILAFTKRAARFCASANGDFTLDSDGMVRWIGQPVGQLVATEEFLNPKLILLADTELTGEARDNVIKRLERFVTFHFETVLKPLFDLRNADSLTDLTRNLALQLVKHLGILPRREIAETVKNLDQESRAVLRQLGVRFGAFHIYVAAMLKPAQVQAITLLWNLQNKGKDQTGLNEIFTALSAGRTSLVVDPTYNRQFYQIAGYRILGQRAVRIDILERLANLIRSALNWKQGTEPKPDGAYDGKSFFATTTMMSILGANGTDMEEILKGLGYKSHPCSSADLEQTFLQNKTSTPACTTKQSTPEAECVGDQWKIKSEFKTAEEKKENLSECVKKQYLPNDHLPEAEPVGDFAKQKRIATEDKVILLWRYNYHTHKKRDKFGQNRQNKHRGAFKSRDSENTSHKTLSYSKNFDKSASLHSKSQKSKASQITKRSNSDSPFAKLAVLRDQLINNKETHIFPFKSH
ncbi:hypothetical protein [Bartonella sp. B41]